MKVRKNVLATTMIGGMLLLGISPAFAARETPESPLQKAIAGRVEGAPVDCLQLSEIQSTRIIDHTAIIFETSGRKLYVNTPSSGASSLDSNFTLIMDTHTPQLCSIDTVKQRDMDARMDAGFVGLGKFVPYTKASGH